MKKEYLITILDQKKGGKKRQKGVVRPSDGSEVLPRRITSSIFMMPFYAYSQGVGGTIEGSHSYPPATVSGFPTQPRNYQDNDLYIFCVETSGDQTVSTPPGWELCPNMPIRNNDTKLTMFWKRVANLEATHTIVDSGEHQIDRLFIIRGCVETGDPFDVSATNTGSGTTITFPSVQSTTDKGLAILATTFDSTANIDDLSAGVNPNFSYIRKHLGFTQEELGYGGGLGFFSGAMPIKGVTGETTTIQSTSTDWTSYTAIIKPTRTKKPYLLNGTLLVVADYPIAVQANDILVCFIETNNETVTIATPSGFTEMDGSPAINVGTNPTRLTMFWKRATSSETYPTFTGYSDHIKQWLVAIRGCIETGNPFESSYDTNTGTGTAITVGGITTTVKNAYVLTILSTTRDIGGAQFTTFRDWTNASLDQFIPHVDSMTFLGTGGGVGLGAGYKETAGEVDATTLNQATSVEWCAWMGALKPAV